MGLAVLSSCAGSVFILSTVRSTPDGCRSVVISSAAGRYFFFISSRADRKAVHPVEYSALAEQELSRCCSVDGLGIFPVVNGFRAGPCTLGSRGVYQSNSTASMHREPAQIASTLPPGEEQGIGSKPSPRHSGSVDTSPRHAESVEPSPHKSGSLLDRGSKRPPVDLGSLRAAETKRNLLTRTLLADFKTSKASSNTAKADDVGRDASTPTERARHVPPLGAAGRPSSCQRSSSVGRDRGQSTSTSACAANAEQVGRCSSSLRASSSGPRWR